MFAAKGDCFQIPASIRDKFMVVDDELLIHRSLLGRSESFSFDGDYYHSNDLIEWVDQQEGIFRFKSRKNELINVGDIKSIPEKWRLSLMPLTVSVSHWFMGSPTPFWVMCFVLISSWRKVFC